MRRIPATEGILEKVKDILEREGIPFKESRREGRLYVLEEDYRDALRAIVGARP